MPLSDVQETIAAMQKAVWRASLLSLLVALALSFYISRSIHEPVAALSDAAERIAAGDFSVRAQGHGKDEIGRLGAVLNQLVARVSDTIAALSSEKVQLQATFDNMVEGVALVDEKGLVQELNPVMEALFGVSAEKARGKSLISTVRQEKLQSLLEEAIESGSARQGEAAVFTPEEKVFEAHANPIMENGAVRGAVLVLHDITRLRRLEEVRKEFVANVSHELRTPLASIKGFAETLLRGGLEDEKNRVEFVETIARHSDRLTVLVDDLLTLAATESGKRVVRKERIGLRQIVSEVWRSLAFLAEERKITFVDKISEGARVEFDRESLSRVLQNLLANAIKYNKEGGRVEVESFANEDAVGFLVRDTGLGVPAKDLPRLFERFYRVDKARSREMGGTGLGLSIVKHMVENNGGTVSVESREGAGSVFRVNLPLKT